MTKPRKKKAPAGIPAGAPPVLDGVTWASQTKASKRVWAITDVMPAHSVTIIEGRKTTGKSTVIAAIVAAWTGGPAVPAWAMPGTGRVLVVTTEDDWETVVHPRLLAAAADLDRVGLLKIPVEGGEPRWPCLPHDMALVEERMGQCQADLLVLDPFDDLAGPGIELTTQDGARGFFTPLNELCRKKKVSCLVSRNMRKGSGLDARDAGLGHSKIGNTVRSVVRCDEHPHEEGIRVMATVACNGARRRPTYRYRIVDSVGESGAIEWLGECTISADEIAEGRGSSADRDEWSDADRVLRTMLGSGWVNVTRIFEEGEAAGISPRMMRRAKDRLKIPTRHIGTPHPGSWQWGPPRDGWPDGIKILTDEQGVSEDDGALGRLASAQASGTQGKVGKAPKAPQGAQAPDIPISGEEVSHAEPA